MRPDEYIERFAGAVLWDAYTGYDYAVDYYVNDAPWFASSFSSCMGYSRLLYDWEDVYGSVYTSPHLGMCRNYFNGFVRCLGFSVYGYTSLCNPYPGRGWRIAGQPPVRGGRPAASAVNEGVVRGGLWRPDTVGRVAGDPSSSGRLTQLRDESDKGTVASVKELEDVFSIPDRAVRTMRKEAEDEQRRKEAASLATSRERLESGLSGRRAEPARPSGATSVDVRRAAGRSGSRETVKQPARAEPPSREPPRSVSTIRERERTRSDAPPRTWTPSQPSTRSGSSRPADSPKAQSQPRTESAPSAGGIKAQAGSDKTKPPQR
jgi:hypothetical protein